MSTNQAASSGGNTTRSIDMTQSTENGTENGTDTVAGPAKPGGHGARASALAIFRALPGPLVGLVVVMIVLSFLSPYFLTRQNLTNIVSQNADIGIMAVGAALVILIGGIDLSVGSTLALSLMTSAWLYRSHDLPFTLCVLAGLLVGALVGLVNGVLSTYGRIQPFVATLATMSAAAGLALYLTDGNPINGFPNWYLAITSKEILSIPLDVFLLVASYVIAAFWLRYRPSGRALYAVGGNAEVARLSGLNVTRIKIGVYVVAGVLAALAGSVVGSRLDSAQPTAGTGDLLNVIAVVVIGGASLSGGSGSMLNTFIGLLIIGVLNNGMSLLNVSPNLQPVVIGIAIIIAVLTDRASRAREAAH
ncbi:ABC transporter permease [Nocardioides sp.]|uniref:ABC transporter permease n=1 Tax=Nocardioides sp. TaxID=35761 RepID=UPI0039E5F19F